VGEFRCVDTVRARLLYLWELMKGNCNMNDLLVKFSAKSVSGNALHAVFRVRSIHSCGRSWHRACKGRKRAENGHKHVYEIEQETGLVL